MKVSVLFFSLLPALLAHAEELRGPEAGVIPYGMGRAYSAVADDWLALHYNPAGLAMVRTVDLQVFDFKLGANSSVVDSRVEVKALSDNTISSVDKADRLMGKNVNAVINNTSQLTVPHFAMAALYDVQIAAEIQNKQYPATKLRFVRDAGFVGGTGLSFGKKKEFRVGASLKILNRTGGTSTLSLGEISSANVNLLDRFSQKGTGYGATLGTQYTFNLKNRREFTLAMVWHDVGVTSFGDSKSGNRPDPINDNLVAGMALRLPIGGKVDRRKARRFGEGRAPHHLTFAFDYSHINLSNDKVHTPKRIHYGANLDLPLISLQVGANQNAITYGATLDILGVRVSGASYEEEMGSFAGQKRDRRYLFSIAGSLGIGKF